MVKPMPYFSYGYLCLSLFVTCYIQSMSCERYVNTRDRSFSAHENVSNVLTGLANNSKLHLPTDDSRYKLTDVDHRLRYMEIPVDSKHLEYRPVTRKYDFVTTPSITRAQKVGLSSSRMPVKNVFVTSNTRRNSFYDITKTPLSTSWPKDRLIKIRNNSESDLYDKSRDTTYLCFSDQHCEYLMENSVCPLEPREIGLSHWSVCKCVPNLVQVDDKCVSVDNFYLCDSHKDCEVLDGSRCTYLVTTVDTKICKCPSNYIVDNYRCLRKVTIDESCVSSSQCPSGISCLLNICRYYCPYGYSIKDDQCVRDIPGIDPRRYNGGPTMSNTVLFGIVGGVVFLTIMVLSMVAIVLRSRMSDTLRRTSTPTSPFASSVETSGQTIRPMSSSLASDAPPSYDEIMTSSTASLTTNVQDQSEDHLPSYKSWEEAYYNRSTIPDH